MRLTPWIGASTALRGPRREGSWENERDIQSGIRRGGQITYCRLRLAIVDGVATLRADAGHVLTGLSKRRIRVAVMMGRKSRTVRGPREEDISRIG
jgi:hypothetical protein